MYLTCGCSLAGCRVSNPELGQEGPQKAVNHFETVKVLRKQKRLQNVERHYLLMAVRHSWDYGRSRWNLTQKGTVEKATWTVVLILFHLDISQLQVGYWPLNFQFSDIVNLIKGFVLMLKILQAI